VSRDGDLLIAIDGPAGAGKSTVGHALAARLGLEYLDTGAMYRAVAWAALRRGLAVDDDAAIVALAEAMSLSVSDEGVYVDGHDVTTAIRGPDVTAVVSPMSAIPGLRAELRARQRAWAREHGGGVIEGRDIGTVVFPHATLKLFITASPRERAERRMRELGGNVDEVAAAIAERDQRDMSRLDGPLRTGGDAVVVDTTGMSISDVVDKIIGMLGPS
jgi:cytidylate kinase